jgi:uncharacterized protein (TIGR03067 family)
MKWIAVLLTAPVLLAPKDSEDAERKKFQGLWLVAAQEVGGKKVEAKKLAGLKMTVAGDKMTTRDGTEVLDESTFRLGPGARPRTIDLTLTAGPHRGKSVRGIYKLEGDTLTVCVGEPNGARPKALVTKVGSGHMLLVFQRPKK